MGVYDELIRKLEVDGVGIAVFRKVILHSHSPDSHDGSGDHEDYENKIFSADIDLLAITDHMKCGFAGRLSADSLGRRPVILPGMEVNFRPPPPLHTNRIHLLVIFPEGTPVEQMDRIMPANIGVESTRNGQEEITGIDIKQFIEDVHRNGGICIAAHVDGSTRGVRSVFRQVGRNGLKQIFIGDEIPEEEDRELSDEFKDWIITQGFDGLELARERDKDHYRWVREVGGKVFDLPTTLTCDTHSIDDLLATERFTYVKMSSVGHKGLSDALRFPDTRIRFPEEIVDADYPRLLGIEIISGTGGGFFSHIVVPFSENLNCLIGPRGSGKSTLMEAIRYILGYNRTLSKIEQPEIEEKVRSLQEHNLNNSIIRLPYQKADGTVVVLEATYDKEEDYSTIVFDPEGNNLDIVDVELAGDFPLRFYGWNEIETLGRKANRQRDLLDRLIPELKKAIEEREEIRSNLRELRHRLEAAAEKMSILLTRDGGLLRRYKEFKTDFDKLNTDQVKELFTNFDNDNAKRRILTNVLSELEDWIEIIEEAQAFELMSEVDPDTYGVPSELEDWFAEKVSELKIHDKRDEALLQLSASLRSAKDLHRAISKEITIIEDQIKASDKAIRDAVSLEATMQIEADHRRQARERLDSSIAIRKEYQRELQTFHEVYESWQEQAENLLRKHNEISGLRANKKNEVEKKIDDLCRAHMTITIDFNGGMDRRDFLKHLMEGGFFTQETHGNFRQKQWPALVVYKTNPIEFVKIITEDKPEKLTGEFVTLRGTIDEAKEDTAKLLIDPFCFFDRDDGAELDLVDADIMNKVLELAEIEWDDHERILMDNRPIEDLSPGQRSSAMLPLIVLVEKAPLVIDQPEDNLDNRLIGNVLVDILANLKEKRQIIVATHNPNIVVLGDSEQVIVMDAIDEKSGKVDHMGSIDNPDIIQSVVDIMEGGEDAFKHRNKRYNF